MNLIITMAGKYERFRSEGYKIPKYLLPFGVHTILSQILSQLYRPDIVKKVFLVANNADKPFMGHVLKIMDSFAISRDNLLLVGDTSGQAETANMALSWFDVTGPVLIHNADTIPMNRDLFAIKDELMRRSSGFIDVFRSNNHAYSYVLAKNGRVEVIGEKILVSDLATSGLYGFSNRTVFHDHYSGQKFISEVYKSMIKNGCDVSIGEVHTEADTIVLGTPEDYLKQSEKL